MSNSFGDNFFLLCFIGSPHELEVIRPVWVDPVTTSPIPLYFGVSTRTSASSSEGFLVTFTPGSRRIQFSPWDFFSEYVIKGSFHFDFFERNLLTLGIYPIGGTPPGFNLIPIRSSWRNTLPFGLILAWRTSDRDRVDRTPNAYRGEDPRSDLMNPGLRGILVALNPTDEGRIGTGRNTPKSITDEGFS
jgi:hypothetical protein